MVLEEVLDPHWVALYEQGWWTPGGCALSVNTLGELIPFTPLLLAMGVANFRSIPDCLCATFALVCGLAEETAFLLALAEVFLDFCAFFLHA